MKDFRITQRDMAQVYVSQSPYDSAFEEELNLKRFHKYAHETGGLLFHKLEDYNGRLVLKDIKKSTPAAKIPRWRSRLRNAWLAKINDIEVSSVKQVERILADLVSRDEPSCHLTFSHPEIRHGLTNDGIPQVNLDQLNPRHEFDDQFEIPDIPVARSANAKIKLDGDVFNFTSLAMKLTRGKLLKDKEWTVWQGSEYKQLDQYEEQGMFGTPTKVDDKGAIFNLVWTYVIKELDNRKKARCTCDGSTRAGQVRVLDYTYANCVDQTSSRLFYGACAAEDLLIFGADVSNAFAEAPPPRQGFYIRPDKAFHEWWTNHKHRDPIPPGYVIPILSAMQGHPESPRLWEKHADKILRDIGLTPTIHEPCLYSGLIHGERVLFKRQVDDFAVGAKSERIANILWDMIDERLTFALKRMGLVDLFNGIDVKQTQDYIKISCETYIDRIMEKHLKNWMTTHDMPSRPTPLPTKKSFITSFLAAKGDPDTKAQAKLAKQATFGYRNAIGELIYALITCRPDLSYATVRAAQYSANPAKIHYDGVKSILKYLYATKDDGIYFWRPVPNKALQAVEPPPIKSNAHDLLLDGRPLDDPLQLTSYVDAEWGTCPQTRRSFTGCCLRLAGGTVAYKTKLQPTVAQSSTEAEFMGGTDAGKMLLYVRSIMWDLGIPQLAASPLYEDNDAATAMANSSKPTTRTRHMDIKYHVLCEWVDRDLVVMERVDTTVNMADHFTKQLGPTLFHRHIDYILGHVPPTYSSCFRRMYSSVQDKLKQSERTTTPLPVKLPTHAMPTAAAAARLLASWSRILVPIW